jgi:N-acetyl-alpha-D-glucosaminyl L-malate synthase BshA
MVTTLHGTDITLVGNHPFYKPAVTFSINKSDIVTSVSESLKEDTLRLFDITNEIHVVPNFIDVEKSQNPYAPCERDLMAEEDEKIITHISNFRPVKRVADVIEVFDRVQKELPSKLVLVGEGPDKQMAESLCREKGIEEKVLFLGNSSEVDKILCFSDLFILPSEKESFGLAALEAMACGVPVVSTNTGGLPEVNIHGKSGFLSDVGDIKDMARNSLHILKDPENLATFKAQARAVASRFETKNIVPLYEAVYQKALEYVS